MAPQEKKWDDSAERDLCVAIILGNQETAKGRHNWPRILEIMNNLGYAFSKDAMSQHFTKTILKEFRARHTADLALETPPSSARKTKAAGSGSGSGSGKTTPGSSTKKRAKRGAAAQNNSKEKMFEDEDEDDDLEATPSKKPKKEEVKDEATAAAAQSTEDDAFQAWAARPSSTEPHPFN